MTPKELKIMKQLLAACRSASKLAWEVGTETEDGYATLLQDSRGDLYRELSDAIEAGQKVVNLRKYA